MIPNNITKEHLIKAIAEIDKDGVRKGRHSSTYDLIYNGKTYPPKLVLSIANRYANDSELDSNDFAGGKGTPAFKILKNEGFEIIPKNKEKDEYSLELLAKELNAKGVSKKHFNIITTAYLLKNDKEISIKEAIEMIKDVRVAIGLNSEYDSIIGRISQDCQYFPNKSFDKVKEFAISVRNNTLISFYKNNINTFPNKEKSINRVINLLNKYVYTNGEISTKSLKNYWIFQGNPKVFDFETALRNEILTDWTVSAHKAKIKPGDLVILWITGNKAGCYAFAEVTSYPHKKTTSPDSHLWKVVDKSELKVDIQVTSNFVENPILKSDIVSLEELKNLKVGNQGTNFTATKEEYQTLLDLQKTNHLFKKSNEENMTFPLNTILYGPPGTGKTYSTILRAAQIIENRVIDTYEEALEVFKANLHNRIEFITFHQNYSYEDFIQGLRPETDDASALLFEKKDGVFKRISDRAKSNPYFLPVGTILKDYTVLKSNEDIVELWSERTKSIRYVPYQLIKDLMDGIDSDKISIEDIKRRRDIDLPALLGSKVEKYYFGIEGTLFNICEFLIDKKEEDTNLNYVLIIDEINRANISRVFGELITLIEPDKRSHGSIPLEARLPSGDPFIVPSNLFIIGTMNTADKSIALLDIALRRRFEFESMYPKYEIEGQEIYDVDILEKINKQIIKSKGHDFQIGHAYFMGDNNDLVQRMNKKVIPLLLEYYMNDEKEVKGILNSAGLIIEENSWPLKISGKND